MSQENVEIVRASIAAFNAGDMEAALVSVHPDVEWYTADEFLDGGDDVVVLGRLHVTGAGSGAATESYRAWVYTLRGGEIVRHLTYAERVQALKAAGLQV